MTVYFIRQVGAPDLVKIGQTDELEERLWERAVKRVDHFEIRNLEAALTFDANALAQATSEHIRKASEPESAVH